MSQALYRKWRPHLWDEVIGQEHIVRTLKNAIRTDRVGHAYLFAGPRGTGKTTTARLLAKAVNCLEEDIQKRPCDQCDHCRAVNEGRFLDLIEIDAASNTSVDDIRELRDKIGFSPSQGKFKVYIIDEVHMLSTAAFNALLKTLEEPPRHAIFILATTEVHKIPATVLSRCQRHEFRRIPVQLIVSYLDKMASGEGMSAQPEALTLIARQSTGCMRDAISLLDQLASTGEGITLEKAQQVLGTATSQIVVELTQAIIDREAGHGLDCIHRALDGGADPRQFARQAVDYLRGLMHVQLGNAEQLDVTSETKAQMTAQARAFQRTYLLETLRLFNQAASEVRTGWQPGLLLELAVAEAVNLTAPQPVEPAYAPQPVYGQSTPAAQTPVVQTVSSSTPAVPAVQTVVQPAVHPAAAPADGKAVSLQTVLSNWQRIRLMVKHKNPRVEGLLNSCKSITIKEGTLVLGFPSELLKSKMETGDGLTLTAEAIVQVLGAHLPIVCVVVTASGEIPADIHMDADGMIGAAIDLGAKIVDKE